MNKGKNILRIIYIFIFLSAFGFQGLSQDTNAKKSVSKNEEREIQNILKEHQRRYPKMQIEDVYKLLHQAALGSEHAVSSEEGAFSWMQNEVAKLSSVEIKEPLIDPIAPDRKIVRVHLRPYIEKKGDLKFLNKAFVQTANTFQGSKEALKRYLDYAIALAEKKDLPFDAQEMKKFFAEKAAANYPAVHHSKTFNENYSPAYRVVAREQLSDDLKKMIPAK